MGHSGATPMVRARPKPGNLPVALAKPGQEQYGARMSSKSVPVSSSETEDYTWANRFQGHECIGDILISREKTSLAQIVSTGREVAEGRGRRRGWLGHCCGGCRQHASPKRSVELPPALTAAEAESAEVAAAAAVDAAERREAVLASEAQLADKKPLRRPGTPPSQLDQRTVQSVRLKTLRVANQERSSSAPTVTTSPAQQQQQQQLMLLRRQHSRFPKSVPAAPVPSTGWQNTPDFARHVAVGIAATEGWVPARRTR